ncbi:hypothetical protein DPMN_136861 [Dreissena polymorpha]|uniref:Uncharacterized protein n=1 Tax=Dreissena polymorpha TaxID=45954 RepID=A0A9D4JE70_DREPO|nr:hypothetical protein DPMN_136861 [Dreissena polymorpha]
MIELNLPAISGSDAVMKGVMERSIRLFFKTGINQVDEVKTLKNAGINPEDIQAISKGQSNQSVEVAFNILDCMKVVSTVGSKIDQGHKTYEITRLNVNKVMLKVHWLPVFFDPDVLKQVFSKIGKVIKVMEDYLIMKESKLQLE